MEQLEEALMRRAKEEDRRESSPLVAEVKVRENDDDDTWLDIGDDMARKRL